MSDESLGFRIGVSESESLRLHVFGRENPGCHDYWDGNWLVCEVRVAVGGFRGKVRCSLRSDDMEYFRNQIQSLFENVAGTARFITLEEWLTVEMKADKLGHIACKAELVDAPGIGNRLSFQMGFDQTYLGPLLDSLRHVVEAFPVIGKP